MEDRQVMELAIRTYGRINQTLKAIEEMAELQKELCKALTEGVTQERLDAISQEAADVEIMLEQLKIIYQNSDKVELWKIYKLLRLENKLTKGGR